MGLKGTILKVILPLIIVAAGAGVMVALIKGRPAPEKVERPDRGALVEVMKVVTTARTVTVSTTGTVQPARRIELMPEVSGTITFVSPKFVSGGFFKKGELLFKIDETDYRLALERALAARVKAEYGLAVTEGQADVARKEWELMEHGAGEEPNPLTLYVPQLKNAHAALAAARASVEEARVRLARTELTAPFDLRVSSESVEVGRYASAGKSVASLSGTSVAEVTVPLPLREHGWIDIPKGGAKGSNAAVYLEIGDRRIKRTGRVDRSVGELDPKSRMMAVIITIDDPYGLEGDVPALPSGAFVDVEIEGKTLSGVVVIPTSAMREGSTVWVVDSESKLRIKGVTVIRTEREEAILGEGLSGGELVVLTTLSGAANGMKLRLGEDSKGE